MPVQATALVDQEPAFERVETFKGGMDGFNRAALLPNDTSQYIENLIVLDSLICQTRPGTKVIGGTQPDGTDKTSLPQPAVTGALYFETPTLSQLLSSRDGNLYVWDNTTYAAMGGYNLSTGDVAPAWAQGSAGPGNYKVFVSDGVQPWQMWDGVKFTALGTRFESDAANGAGEVVVGAGGGPGDAPQGCTIMCWQSRRMFASGNESAPDQVWASDIEHAEDGHWDHVRFSWRVGYGEGEAVVAIAPAANDYTVFLKRSSVWVVQTLPSATGADQWISSRVSQNIGCVGRDAWVIYGDDVWFLSPAGIHSVRRVAAQQDYEVTPPVSEPVKSIIDRINWPYAYKACAWKFKQYLFFSVPLDNALGNSHTLVYNGRTQSWSVFSGLNISCFATTHFGTVPKLVFGEGGPNLFGCILEWLEDASPDLPATFMDRDTMPIATAIRLKAWQFGDPVSSKDGYYWEVRFNTGSDAVATITPYLDEVAGTPVIYNTATQGQTLPIPALPFDLDVMKPFTARGNLMYADRFNEMFLEVKSDAGRLAIKNATGAAWTNPVDND